MLGFPNANWNRYWRNYQDEMIPTVRLINPICALVPFRIEKCTYYTYSCINVQCNSYLLLKVLSTEKQDVKKKLCLEFQTIADVLNKKL